MEAWTMSRLRMSWQSSQALNSISRFEAASTKCRHHTAAPLPLPLPPLAGSPSSSPAPAATTSAAGGRGMKRRRAKE